MGKRTSEANVYRPLKYQTMHYVRSNSYSLKFEKFTPSAVCRDIRIIKRRFVIIEHLFNNLRCNNNKLNEVLTHPNFFFICKSIKKKSLNSENNVSPRMSNLQFFNKSSLIY